MFPKIENIKDVLPYVEDKKEIKLGHKEDISFLCYAFPIDTTFDSMFARECRGIKFCSKTGDILARPYHKFFNLNETQDTQEKTVSWESSHIILEKLDGSMIHPLIINEELRYYFKMGDLGSKEKKYITSDHDKLSRYLLTSGYTPIYELCSLENRIIIPYEIGKLVLTAVRNTINGTYLSYEDLVTLGRDFKVPVVGVFESDSIKDISEFKKRIFNLKGEEGCVIRFSSGEMIKMKAYEYVLIHKNLESLTYEKDLLKLIFEDKLDDIIPLIDPITSEKVQKYSKDTLHHVSEKASELQSIVEVFIKENGKDRRKFAELATSHNLREKVILFNIFDGHDAYEAIRKTILKQTGTQKDVVDLRKGGIISDQPWER